MNYPTTSATNVELVIKETSISQDTEGRFRVNDLHKAAGGKPGDKWQPSNWLSIDQTKGLIAALEADVSREDSRVVAPVKVINGGRTPGTYVCRELVYSYAMWISPQFSLDVIRAFDQLQRQPVALPMDEEEVAQLYLAAIQEKKRLQRQIASNVLTPRPTFEENAEGIALQRIKREIAPYLSIKVIAHVLKHFGQKRTFVQYGEHENQVVKPFVREGVEEAIRQFLEQADYRLSYSRKTVVLTHDCLLGDEAQVSAEDAIAYLGYAPAEFGLAG